MSSASLAAVILTTFSSTPAAVATPQLTLYGSDYEAVLQSPAAPGGPGYALYRAPLSFTLEGRSQSISRGGMPRALDASSIRLQPQGNAVVLEQRFDFSRLSGSELLRRSLGKNISVEQVVGSGSQRHTGELLGIGDGLTLRLPDGRIRQLTHYNSIELTALPAGLVNEPTVTWTVNGKGKQTFDFHYTLAGLAWRAEYQATLAGQGSSCRMQLEGAAMIANRAGMDFTAVALTLVAGEPRRLPGSGPHSLEMAAAPHAKMTMAGAAIPAQATGDYHAYALPGTHALPDDSIQRVPLFDSHQPIACERRYETGDTGGYWQPPHPLTDTANSREEQPVNAILAFDNRKATGLGLPLPAGRLRVFEGNDFLGEARIEHTAVNRRIEITTGQAFDLSAQRTRKDFTLDRAGRQMQERIDVVIRNAKPTAVSVRAIERMARWSDWEIIASSHPATKSDAQHALFELPVPANGETTLSYTVRYRWTPDIRLP